MNIDWKKIAPELAIVGIFIIASAIYFFPALEGKVIYAGDYINGRAACQESIDFHEETGDYSFWSGSMFSGMPNYQIGANGGFAVDKILNPIRWVLKAGNRNVFFLFLYLLIAFYLLLRTFKIENWLSMAGAFAMAMSSYFFVIVTASHNGKAFSITWMTLVLIGMILTYRKNYAWGALLIMFFTYIGFFQHPQMSYYMCMLMGVLFFAEVAIAVRNKEWKHFAIATAIFFASFGIGMGMGSGSIFSNQEYTAETMRGGHSDLAKESDDTNKTKGLDLDYATAWSYGKAETMTFLIPNFMGGASGYNIGTDSRLYKDLVQARVPKSTAKQFCQSAPTYWGEKAFTSGPVYLGAIVCFLFLLGLLIVPGPYKWALLVATLFSLFLSWGKNMMWLTEFFFNYFPMYNKFRAVESILIVAEITVPLLGFLAVKEIAEAEDRRRFLPALYISAGITAGICLIMALFGSSLIDFTSTYDNQWKAQVGDDIYGMILDQRAAMMTSDAWRSFIFIALGFGLLFFYIRKPFKTQWLGIALTALIVADLWPVDKRYCNDSHFVSVKERDKVFNMLPYEKELLQNDKTYYRVMNLTTNTFNDARTSYYLKSIGGYSAAKLRRYQDLIDEHLSKMHMPVLNMLNTKYFITQDRNGQVFPYLNDEAFGNCWLVDELVGVHSANEESDALTELDLKRQAVYDETYEANSAIPAVTPTEAGDYIALKASSPKQLEYHASVAGQRMAVFSEIYYPYGWKATIDGKPADIYRVNYMLRALAIPSGEHDIVMFFAPDSIRKGNILGLSCFAVFLMTLIGALVLYFRSKRKDL
mgnify:FL=1